MNQKIWGSCLDIGMLWSPLNVSNLQTGLSITVLTGGVSKMKKSSFQWKEAFLSTTVEKKTFYLFLAYLQNGFEVNCKNCQHFMVLTMSYSDLRILRTLANFILTTVLPGRSYVCNVWNWDLNLGILAFEQPCS